MNFSGFTPSPIDKWCGLEEQNDPTSLPIGMAVVAKNVRFHLQGVATRYGIKKQFQTGSANPVSGGAGLQYVNATTGVKTQNPLVYDQAGNLFVESPTGSGTLVNVKSLTVSQGPANSQSLVTLPAGQHMQVAPAFNRGYLAFTDLKNGQALPAVWDMATNRLDPSSMKLAGQVFTANTQYSVGELICPTVVGGNGHTYSVTVAGTSGAEPVWPLTTGGTITSGGVTFQENTLTLASSASAGNICSGPRYAFVLFQDFTGYITGMSAAAVISFTIAANGFQLSCTNIPKGPANTQARIVCFSPAQQTGGAVSVNAAGPFWYVPANDVSAGISMTSTVINDNTTTSGTFNFTDDYLIKLQLTNVTNNFRIIQIPASSDVYFAKSIQRMVYTVPGTGFYLSLPSDPSTVYGDTGKVLVAVNNGEREICWREWRGTQFAFKEKSAYVVTPSASDPSQWDAVEQWNGSGPCGPRAIDVTTKFLAYVHRSGVYAYSGDKPFRINKEIPNTWATINWNYQHVIWLLIDEESKQIFIGVPTGNNTVPDTILKLNYEESDGEGEALLAEGLHLTLYGKMSARAIGARKWSVDTGISAMLGFRAERVLPSAGVGGTEYQQSQILFCSALNDGAVHAIVPNQYNDNAAGIDCQYETACPEELMKVNRLGGVQANIDGNGQAFFSVIGGRATASNPAGPEEIDMPIPANLPSDKGYACGARGMNEKFRLRVTNGNTADNWFDLKFAAIYATPVFSARTGSGNTGG